MEKVPKSAYGPGLLTILSLLFLTLVIPWATAFSIQLAYLTNPPVIDDHPDRLYAINASSVSGPVEEKTYHHVANNETYAWVHWVDNPETSPNFNKDCEPYDWTLSQTGFPSTNYSVTLTYGSNLTETPEYAWADNPFKTQGSGICTTLEDEIGVRLYPPAAFSAYSTTQWPSNSIGMAMIEFDASMVQMNANDLGYGGYNATAYAEFDWRLEIDGVVMFSESVRAGDADSLVLNEGIFGNDSIFNPMVKFKHTLQPAEEMKVRNALAGKQLDQVNMTLIWQCHDTSTLQGQLPNGMLNEACEIWNMDVASSSNTDIWFTTQVTWLQADDYDFVLQVSAWIMAAVMFTMAIASTPAWDPFKKLVKGT